jgi:hypothetical protein
MKKRKSSKVTYDLVRCMAFKLPYVKEGTSYGTPALKVKGKLFVRLREEGDAIVLRMPFEERDGLIADDPETYYTTDHYREYPYVLVRLAAVDPNVLPELRQIAHRAASPVKRAKPYRVKLRGALELRRNKLSCILARTHRDEFEIDEILPVFGPFLQ